MVYVELFTRYSEICIVIHSNKNALKVLNDLVESTCTDWELLMSFESREDTLQVGNSWADDVSKILEDIEYNLKRKDSHLDSVERATASRLLELYNDIENTAPSLSSILENNK